MTLPIVERLQLAIDEGAGELAVECRVTIEKLVEALERAAASTRTLARNILDDVGPGSCDGWVSALNTISRGIEADLAKIGGDAAAIASMVTKPCQT